MRDDDVYSPSRITSPNSEEEDKTRQRSLLGTEKAKKRLKAFKVNKEQDKAMKGIRFRLDKNRERLGKMKAFGMEEEEENKEVRDKKDIKRVQIRVTWIFVFFSPFPVLLFPIPS